jgi:hypothetical protein
VQLFLSSKKGHRPQEQVGMGRGVHYHLPCYVWVKNGKLPPYITQIALMGIIHHSPFTIIIITKN